jgi:acyl carrier protein
MNEKIRAFVRDSGIIINPEYEETIFDFLVDRTVRECIKKIEDEAVQYAEPVWAFEIVNDIKEHFGVKP